jgi:hypothetical protein
MSLISASLIVGVGLSLCACKSPPDDKNTDPDTVELTGSELRREHSPIARDGGDVVDDRALGGRAAPR